MIVRIRYVVQIPCIMNLFDRILKRFDKSAYGLLGANDCLVGRNDCLVGRNDGLLVANDCLPRANHNNMRWNNSKRRALSLGNEL